MVATKRVEEARAHAAAKPGAEADNALRAAQADLDAIPSKGQIKRSAKRTKGKFSFTLQSDNLELRHLGTNLEAAVATGAGKVAAGRAALASLPVTGATVVVTQAELLNLLQSRQKKADRAAMWLREVAVGGKGAVTSIDGHIGLVGVLINGWGFFNNLESFNSKDGGLLEFANTVDSLMGVIAGTAQITEAAVSASIASRLGSEAVGKAVSIMGIKVVASAAAAASGFAVMTGQFIKASRAKADGDVGAYAFYSASGVAFGGFFGTHSIILAGAFYELSTAMIARGAKGAIWRIGASTAARAVARFAGTRWVVAGTALAVGLPGIGLMFLAAGLVFEIGALMLLPNAMQKYVRRTYFGTGPDHFPNLSQEIEAVEKLAPARPPEPQQASDASTSKSAA